MAAAGSSLEGWREELRSRGPASGKFAKTDIECLKGRQESRSLSPHHRFLIAMYSPAGAVETGLLICVPEKAPQGPPLAWRGTLSPVRFEGKIMRNRGDFPRFPGGRRADFSAVETVW